MKLNKLICKGVGIYEVHVTYKEESFFLVFQAIEGGHFNILDGNYPPNFLTTDEKFEICTQAIEAL